MEIVTDLDSYDKEKHRPLSLTMGDFDGLHLAHERLIKKTMLLARQKAYHSAILTFDPSPKTVLEKMPRNERLFTLEEKKKILSFYYRLDLAFILPFTPRFSRMSAARYLKDILLTKMNMRQLVIGHDHHFGYRRRGNYSYLSLAAKRYGFEVYQVEQITYKGEVVSSSLIRRLLDEGLVHEANRLLCVPYFLYGQVELGHKLGYRLGFPTANVAYKEEKKLPQRGVYFGAVFSKNNLYRALINIGTRPTVDGKSTTVEAHLLNFSGNLYGEHVYVFFIRKIREEYRFPSLEALSQQIQKDIEQSQGYSILPEISSFCERLR
ncbi:MAG: bifunctional riboflavin kinase/FAD synthetase [Leptospiraceae bacterium]|nr:bifunctional riboflavin kinase/FAD synthetase [Leptospiraceae bacterium]